MIRQFALSAAIVLVSCAPVRAADSGDSPPPPPPERPDNRAEIEARKSYAIPALEIAGFEYLLNRFNRAHYGADYASNLSTARRNLRSGWTTDRDPFKINQLGHPYQGSMYHGFARSAGLSYWESLAYSFAGSAAWEIAGENTPPSRNDQIASGIGGTFLGEALFRMASLVLEKGNDVPSAWREAVAAVISPPTGFNRLAFGERFGEILNSNNPAYYSRMAIAVSGTTRDERGTSANVKRGELLADYSLDYGLPGKPGYHYEKPFDYFTFQATASSANGFENVMTRGLLLGTSYDIGERYRGIWGLFGSYDYIAPQTFRVSSTALSLGTTGQLRLSEALALQGTLLGGVGYTAVGTVNGTNDHDYHYGVAPQALLGLRVIFGDRASLDVTGREYFVSRVAASPNGGHDNVLRADVAFTVRIHKQHAIAVRYLWNRRDATFAGPLGDQSQTHATIGLYYTFLGDERFGAVEWR